MTRKRLSFDGVGYVSGKGSSKYWGVASYNKVNGRDYAIQLYRPNNRIPKWLIPTWEAREEELAMVAASYYENDISKGLSRIVVNRKTNESYYVDVDGHIVKTPTHTSFSNRINRYFF